MPQKTSENIDNLQIDLFSKTLPVEWNDKMLEYNAQWGNFRFSKFHLLSDT